MCGCPCCLLCLAPFRRGAAAAARGEDGEPRTDGEMVAQTARTTARSGHRGFVKSASVGPPRGNRPEMEVEMAAPAAVTMTDNKQAILTARSATDLPSARPSALGDPTNNTLLEICGDLARPASSLLEASARRLMQHQNAKRKLLTALNADAGGDDEAPSAASLLLRANSKIRNPANEVKVDDGSDVHTDVAERFVHFFLQALQLGDITWALGYDVGLLFATDVTMKAPDGMRYAGKAAVVKRLNGGVERLLKFTGPGGTTSGTGLACAKPNADTDDIDVKDVDKLREKFELVGPTVVRAEGAEWGAHRGGWVVCFAYKFRVNRMLSYAFEDRFAMRGKTIAALIRKRIK